MPIPSSPLEPSTKPAEPLTIPSSDAITLTASAGWEDPLTHAYKTDAFLAPGAKPPDQPSGAAVVPAPAFNSTAPAEAGDMLTETAQQITDRALSPGKPPFQDHMLNLAAMAETMGYGKALALKDKVRMPVGMIMEMMALDPVGFDKAVKAMEARERARALVEGYPTASGGVYPPDGRAGISISPMGVGFSTESPDQPKPPNLWAAPERKRAWERDEPPDTRRQVIRAPRPDETGWSDFWNGIKLSWSLGYGRSISGMLDRGELPANVELKDLGVGRLGEFIGQLGTMGGDAPFYAMGGLAGGGVGGPVGASVGAFGITEAKRAQVIWELTWEAQHGRPIDYSQLSFDERMDLAAAIAKHGGIGAAEGLLLSKVPGAVGKGVRGATGDIVAARGAAFASETATLGLSGPVLEGRVPSLEDFENAALLLGMFKGAHAVREAMPALGRTLAENYIRTGIWPREQVRNALARETVAEAFAEGKTDAATAQLADTLLRRSQAFDADSAIEVSRDLIRASKEEVESAGMKYEAGRYYLKLGETESALAGDALQTTIRLFGGHDAKTMVEEWYHRAYDRLAPAERKVFEKYHEAVGGDSNAPASEWFAREGTDFFFADGLDKSGIGRAFGMAAEPLREVFQQGKDFLLRLAGRVDQVPGAKVPEPIREMYRAAGLGKETGGLRIETVPEGETRSRTGLSYQIKKAGKDSTSAGDVINEGNNKAEILANKTEDGEGTPEPNREAAEPRQHTTSNEKEPSGGAYYKVKMKGREAHHIPSDSVSPVSRGKGPAISMEKRDHRDTDSHGRSKNAQAFRKEEEDLIEQGMFDEAQQKGIEEIRSKFGTKYDKQIDDMKKYSKGLDSTSIKKGEKK